MIRRTKRLAGSWRMLFFVLAYLALEALPAAIWYNPKLMTVATDKAGEITVTIERDIRFDPVITYTVTLREAVGLRPVCEGESGPFQYRSEAARASPVAVFALPDWWGPHSNCRYPPDPGEYVLETCWAVKKPLLILRDKTVCISSSVFDVY